MLWNWPGDDMEESEEDVNWNTLQAGKYVESIYDSDWYPGNIRDRSDEHSDILVSFMKWSKSECWVPFQQIMCAADAPSVQGTTVRLYTINPADLQKIQTLFL